jgi:hypothetical protein
VGVFLYKARFAHSTKSVEADVPIFSSGIDALLVTGMVFTELLDKLEELGTSSGDIVFGVGG